jgi:hypothetical protein
MNLKEKIRGDLNEAVKKREALESSVLRLLLAAILNKEKEKRYKTYNAEPKLKEEELTKKSQLTDEEITEVIFSEVKKRKEAILEFGKGKREDLVRKETKEMELLKKYLPEQLSEEEIKKIAQDVIKKIGAQSPKDMGRVMSELMPKLKGKADGSLAGKAVKDLLSSKI